jgi:hypothetical protein
MELLWVALPFLVFLACPLMMVFCFLGMRKMGCSTPQAKQTQAVTGTPEEQVAALKLQLAAVEADLATSRAQPERNSEPIGEARVAAAPAR